jgi:serpin B
MRHLAVVVATTILGLSALGGFAEDGPGAKTDLATVVASDNTFALDLYAHLAKEEGNLFLSPASISTALAMTYAGARGQTADEMARTLHFTLDQQRLHPAFAGQLREWKAEGKKRSYQLSVANALWGQKGFGFVPEFLNLTRTNYGAGLVEVNFAADPELARRTINEWVEQQTRQKIKDLLKPQMINSLTRLVLTNAIYFKGDWQAQFNKAATQDQDFHVSADTMVKVPLMHRTGQYRYLDGGNFQALELPYAGKDLAMVVLLPRKPADLGNLEKVLSTVRLQEWLGKSGEQDVSVWLPRFKMTKELQLNQVLADMGMPTAFIDGKADFSGMSGSRPPLHISQVVHKAFVDVNEEGTEAAAATAVILSAPTALPRRPVSFRADHPFVFLIRDMHTGSILFMGRVNNPKA